MTGKFIRAALAATLAAAICAPLPALAQEHDRAEHAKSRYGQVPGDFYQRDWLWVDRGENYENVQKILGKKAPKFIVDDFFENSDDKGKPIEKMKGKIVLIDFWATWCGPCIKNIPHTNEMAQKYKKYGVEVVGICCTRGAETMTESATGNDMFIPTAADQENKTAEAFGVQWWPYYVVVDRDGIVRAAGVNAEKVEEVLDALLEFQPRPADDRNAEKAHDEGDEHGEGGEHGGGLAINEAWLEGDGGRRNKLAKISGQTAPALQVSNWINADEMSLEDLEGKVVMLDFWATWCPPCIRAIPHTNELQEKYADDGLVIIGVCHQRGSEKMAQTVEDKGIEYPVVADTDGETVKSFAVDSFPDYYFIDRNGHLVVADAKNGNVEDIIKLLLANEG